MNQSIIERGLILLGAIVLGLFALSYAIPTLNAWTDQIRILAVLGVLVYVGYQFWTQSKDAKTLHEVDLERLKWKREADQLQVERDQLRVELGEATALIAQSKAELEAANLDCENLRSALKECQESKGTDH